MQEYLIAKQTVQHIFGIDWKNEEEISLKLNGLDLGSVWDNFVTQVSGINVQAGNTLAEQINVEAEKEKLRKQINDLELKARKEVQAKKKFEMVQRLQQFRRKLKEIV